MTYQLTAPTCKPEVSGTHRPALRINSHQSRLSEDRPRLKMARCPSIQVPTFGACLSIPPPPRPCTNLAPDSQVQPFHRFIQQSFENDSVRACGPINLKLSTPLLGAWSGPWQALNAPKGELRACPGSNSFAQRAEGPRESIPRT